MKTPNPWYRQLVDLLFENKLLIPAHPDMDVLLQVAHGVIKGQRDKLNRQSTMLALALKAKNDAIDETIAVKQNLGRVVDENTKLIDQLARLQPPPAKFRVGQVVIIASLPNAKTFAVKLVSRKYQNLSGAWCYTDTCDRFWGEECLRELTDEER